MQRLGIDTMLVCSNVGTATIDDDEVSAGQLRELGDLAATYGVRLAFEALAWGRFVDDYRRAWRIVELADHPNVGVCLDSFHILSRGHDPAGDRGDPRREDLLPAARRRPGLTHGRAVLEPAPPAVPRRGRLGPRRASSATCSRTGYDGPLSLEVFNDTFRQTDPAATARHAQRSLLWLEDQAARLPRQRGRAATARAAARRRGADRVRLRRGQGRGHRRRRGAARAARASPSAAGTAPSRSRLWTAGRGARGPQRAAGPRRQRPTWPPSASRSPTRRASATRARAPARRPRVYRRTYAGEERAGRPSRAPDGTEIFLGRRAGRTGRRPGSPSSSAARPRPGRSWSTGVDHVNLAQPWQHFDEAVLFYSSVLGLEPQAPLEVAGPIGLVRSQVMRTGRRRRPARPQRAARRR